MNNFWGLLSLFTALILAACSFSDKESGHNPVGRSNAAENMDVRLINTPPDEAWIDNYEVGNRDGFILRSDGSFSWIVDYPGTWQEYIHGTWSTANNNILILTAYGETEVLSYSFSGDNLIIDGDWIFTRTPGIVIGGDPDPGINPGDPDNVNLENLDSRLINTLGREAWIDNYPVGEREGFIFRQNGDFVYIYEENGTWKTDASGTWSTSNHNVLTLNTQPNIEIRYSMLGNMRLLTESGIEYNRTLNVVVGGASASGSTADIVGIWTDQRTGETYTFNADGTGTWFYSPNTPPTRPFVFRANEPPFVDLSSWTGMGESFFYIGGNTLTDSYGDVFVRSGSVARSASDAEEVLITADFPSRQTRFNILRSEASPNKRRIFQNRGSAVANFNKPTSSKTAESLLHVDKTERSRKEKQ